MLINGEFIYKLVLTVTGVALFAYIDRARTVVTVASCICGATAFTVSELLTVWLGNGFVMYFASASVTCFLAEAGARIMRVPVTVILLPAIIPLVPGALLYNTMRALMLGNGNWYTEYGGEALRSTAGIGCAIVFTSAMARLGYGAIYKLRVFIRKNKNRAA